MAKIESRLRSLETSCSSNTQALARIEVLLRDLCHLALPGKSGPGGTDTSRLDCVAGGFSGVGERQASGRERRGSDDAVHESAMAMRQMAEDVADDLKGRRRRRKPAADTSVPAPGIDRKSANGVTLAAQAAVEDEDVAGNSGLETSEASNRRKRRQEKRGHV